MKNLIIIAIALLIGLIAQTQTLKGYTLGKQLTGKSELLTTVAGIDGIVYPQTLKDGRIYLIVFIPSDDGIHTARVYKNDIIKLVKGIEGKYHVKLIKKMEEYGDGVDYYYTRDWSFFIDCDYNKFMDVPYELTFSMGDAELQKIKNREDQAEANSDF